MTIGVAIAVFVAMEGFTYLAHRFVMHGAGWVLHRSHHAPTARRLEANDTFPLVFGSLTMAAMAIGFRVPLDILVAGTVGVSAYGLAYMFVHDIYIHARLGRLPKVALLERLKTAHAEHHRLGAEPYGMLFPTPRRGSGPP